MRIAQIAPLYESVPPKLYGGTERVVAHLTNALVERGHEVTLFATGDSQTKARLIPCRDLALRLDTDLSWDLPAHLAMLAKVRAMADEFEVLHFHLDCHHFPFFVDCAERTLTTLHGRQDIDDLTRLRLYYPQFPMISISTSQRVAAPQLNWIDTIHHGYPVNQYRPSPNPTGGYLAFLGRIAPEKGVDRAIEIAERVGIPLRIAAKVDSADRAYYNEVIAPLLRDVTNAKFIGEITEAEKSSFLGGAACLLFPIDWPEPFGLVMIESMACGTPVIAFDRGSTSEIIDHGVTGFVVDTAEEAAAAVRRAKMLDRRRIRRTFERRFTDTVMASAYEASYERLIRLTDRGHAPHISAVDGRSAESMPAELVRGLRSNAAA
jgi:glycosyltransferase involved in cell wall biosynthesis